MGTEILAHTIIILAPDGTIETDLSSFLDQRHIRLRRFASGRKGLKAIQEIKPSLIISDFHTSDWNGEKLFSEFLRDPAYGDVQHIPFIFYTDESDRSFYGNTLFRMGLDGWYTRSIGAEALSQIIQNLVLRREESRRNRELRQEIKRSEYRYRDLLENANDFIFTLDDEGRFTYLNNRFTPLTGFDKDAWFEKSLLDLIHEKDRKFTLERYNMAHQGKARIFEARIVSSASHASILSFNITPILERGQIVGSIGIARDVTEQKKMEREILDLKNFNESIIKSMEAGLLTTDLAGHITYLNGGAERILGWKLKQIVRKQIRDVLQPEEANYLLSSPPPPGSLPYSREMELTVKSGQRIVIGFTTTDRIDNSNKKVGTIVSFRDITQLKQMQSEVIRMDRLASLGVLASGIAHEIKNPLAGIKTMAQACEEEFMEEDPRREYLTRIIRQVNRLDDLLKTFFAYARPKKPDRQPHTLEDILREVSHLLTKRLKEGRISYSESFGSDLRKIMVDSQQIQQVFLNLILNSVEAMPGGGKLKINAENIDPNRTKTRKPERGSMDNPSSVRIEVSDTGKGIDTEKLEKIFDPFFTTKPNGLGLGLSIVYRIVKEHQGDIRVSSKPGQGTTFILILPSGDCDECR